MHKKLSSARWRIFAMALMIFALNINFSAVNLIIAPLAKVYGVPLTHIQWIITAFTLTAAAFMIISGRLADIKGWQNTFVLGAVIFLLSCVLAGFSTSLNMLIICRAVEGIGFAIVFPSTLALAFAAAPDNYKGHTMGIIFATAGICQALSPVVGGFILHLLNWRWIFFISIPFGLLAILFSILTYEREKQSVQKGSLNIMPAVFLAICLFTLSDMFSGLNLLKNHDTKLWIMLMTFVGSAFLFIRTERRSTHRLLDLSVFRNKQFLIFSIIRFFIEYIYFAFLFCFPILFQNILGYSAIKTGLLLMIMTGAFGGLSFFAGKWLDGQRNIKFPFICGLLLFIIAYAMLTNMPIPHSWKTFILPFLLLGIALAIMLPNTMTMVLKSVPKDKTSYASALLYTCAFFGGSLGVSTSSILMTRLNKYHLLQLINTKAIHHVSSTKMAALTQTANGTGSIHLLQKLGFHAHSIRLVQSIFMHGFSTVMWVCCALSLLSLALVFIIDNKKTELSSI